MIKDLLKKYWGYDSFRPMQEEIIASVLSGHDTLALLPTGGGKSLCYQLPALELDGLCLVVSPLIALMKDQVQQLTRRGIKAACLVSGMNSYEQEVVLNNCVYGKTKLLYVSPERLQNHVFLGHFRQMKVSFIAVDEAHCISQWGYDFRPSYLRVAEVRALHPSAPVLALTATATPEVVKDIQQKLLFRNGQCFQTSFFRSNLAYMVFCEEDKIGRLVRILGKVGGCGIVYVRNRRRTQEVANQLTSHGISATYYHAGLTPQERDQRQQWWMQGQVKVMVATNAFGMGIDKSDVRAVVHLDIPNCPEAYFQEAGRAGRDGQRSYAVLLYNDADLRQLDSQWELSFPPMQQIRNVYRATCNYYQIPVGSGVDSRFDFDIEEVCRTYAFSVAEYYMAVQFLEREGLISLPERGDVESRLYIPVSREEVYRYQVEHVRYGELLMLVVRTYGGVFSDFVPISEAKLARACYSTEDQVTRMLQQMDAHKVVSYQKKSSRPQIVFTAPRIEADNLYISDQNYKHLREAAARRKEAMRSYVCADDTCRSELLLRYFGEEQQQSCGQCDVCLGGQKSSFQSLQEQILARLGDEHLTVQQLAERIPNVDEEEFQQALRELLDYRKVHMTEDFILYR